MHWTTTWLNFLALLVLVCSSGCVRTPQGGPERALYLDLERVVSTKERTVEWVVDRAEAEDSLPTLLRSVCKVRPERRASLERWLDAEIAALGGSAEAVYLREGRDLDAAEEILRLERVRAMLRYADARAEEDCPFWFELEEDFKGVHSDAGRLVLYLESNGGGWVVFRGDETFIGGGGSARVSIGFGLTQNLTLLLGAELGGQGNIGGQSSTEGDQEVTEGEQAEAEQQVDANFVIGAPVVLRLIDASRLYDLEVAAIALTNPQSDLFQPGGRVLVGTGLATPRIGALMPTAVFMGGYEFYPARAGLPTTHLIRIGTRVGVGLDF